jgi:hypothetical protein
VGSIQASDTSGFGLVSVGLLQERVDVLAREGLDESVTLRKVGGIEADRAEGFERRSSLLRTFAETTQGQERKYGVAAQLGGTFRVTTRRKYRASQLHVVTAC